MMNRYLLCNALIVTGERAARGALSICGDKIEGIRYYGENETGTGFVKEGQGGQAIDLEGKILMAGGIDAHVHFREPGMTEKADLRSESRAALLGGITSFIDMPNTNPPTIDEKRLLEKIGLAQKCSYANFGFHIGATNGNYGQIASMLQNGKGELFGGIKLFLGSSTGNLLVDNDNSIDKLFRIKEKPILIHSEDESVIKANLAAAKKIFGNDVPFSEHENIRSRTACIRSTAKALELAIKYGTRLHILHISTAEEVDMIRTAKHFNQNITAETSANYLYLSERDYSRLGCKMKCNPSIKAEKDRKHLWEGLKDGTIDTIGSDHAPHLLSEKERPYLEAPSGIPSVQQSLSLVLSMGKDLGIPIQRIASAFSEKPAEIFGIVERGRLRPGQIADLVVVDPNQKFTVGNTGDFHKSGSASISCKCGWSPYEGTELSYAVKTVFLNGKPVATTSEPDADEAPQGRALSFE